MLVLVCLEYLFWTQWRMLDSLASTNIDPLDNVRIFRIQSTLPERYTGIPLATNRISKKKNKDQPYPKYIGETDGIQALGRYKLNSLKTKLKGTRCHGSVELVFEKYL